MNNFESAFNVGDGVHIDGNESIRAVVVSVMFRHFEEATPLPLYEVSWFHNGLLQSGWVNEWRLTYA